MSEKDSVGDYVTRDGVKRRKLKREDTIFYLDAWGDGEKWVERDELYEKFLPPCSESWKGQMFRGHYISFYFHDLKKRRDWENATFGYLPWPIHQYFN